MKPTDKAEFFATVSVMLETYNRNASQSQLAIWWEVCRERDLQDIKAAMADWLRSEEKFAPLPGQIRKEAGKIKYHRRQRLEAQWNSGVIPFYSAVRALQKQKAPMEEINAAIARLNHAELVAKEGIASGKPPTSLYAIEELRQKRLAAEQKRLT